MRIRRACILSTLLLGVGFSLLLSGGGRVAEARAGGNTLQDDSWMAGTSAIAAMRAHPDGPAARQHGWNILNALLPDSPGGEAAWDRWETKCTLGLASSNTNCAALAPAAVNPCSKPGDTRVQPALETPVQQKKARQQGAAPLAVAVPTAFVSSVRYDPAAADFIRTHKLCSPDGVMDLARSGESFTRSARIVKLIWAAPSNGQIYVWSPSLGYPAAFQPLGYWPKLAVDMNNDTPCPTSPHPVFQTYTGEQPAGTVKVPMNCFYHRPFDCLALTKLKASTVGDLPRCQSPNGTVELLLMGVHVITAEQPDWVWATYYWMADPAHDAAGHAGQTDAIGSRGAGWFYNMSLTLDTTPSPGQNGPRVAFNPYLEGQQRNGTSSNCMYCHRLAVLRQPNTQPNAPSGGKAVALGAPAHCVFDAAPCGGPVDEATYFAGATRTHMLWSVADNLDPSISVANMLPGRRRSPRNIR